MFRILLYIIFSPFILIYYIIEFFRNLFSKNEEIKEVYSINNDISYIDYNNKEIELNYAIKRYDKMMNIIDKIETDEILEYLIEFEKLDEIVEKLNELNYKPMSNAEYKEFKNYKIITKFQMKLNRINKERNKKEKIKSLIGEIETCKKRFSQYSDVFDNEIELLNNTLSKIK